MTFNDLETVKFQEKLKPYVIEIYKKHFGDCEIEDLRSKGFKVHILDKEYAIDSLLKFKDGHFITIQEKYRDYSSLHFFDFTQEYKNAVGTNHESNGEWFKLAAQMYFYGWSKKDYSGFEEYVILDILKYKIIVEQFGGIEKIGIFNINKKHGKASFYGISIYKIRDAIIFASDNITNRILNYQDKSFILDKSIFE